jgi:hypothetical protein
VVTGIGEITQSLVNVNAGDFWPRPAHRQLNNINVCNGEDRRYHGEHARTRPVPAG